MKLVVGLVLLVAVVFFASESQATPLWPLQWSAGWNFVNTTNRKLINWGSYFYHSNNDQTTSKRELRIDNYNCPHYPGNLFFKYLFRHMRSQVTDSECLGRSIFCSVIFARDDNVS